MSSIKCPNCGEEIPKDLGISWGDTCPFCLTPLVNKEAASFGATTIGDANAISGGIHNTDSHNVDSHNVTQITNYVQECKNPEAHKVENASKFRDLCKRIIKQGGRLSQDGKEILEDRRYQLGIDEITANTIIEEVKRSAIKTAVSSLSVLDRMTLTNAKMSVSNNSKNTVRALEKLGPLAVSCNDEEVKFYYYLLLAAQDSSTYIRQYEDRKEDSYWQTYWAYMAYSKERNISGAQSALIALKAWPDMPEFNQLLLGAAGDYSEIADSNDAIEEMATYLNSNDVEYSGLLEDFKLAVSSLYSGFPLEDNFYLYSFGLEVHKKAINQKEEVLHHDEQCIEAEVIKEQTIGQEPITESPRDEKDSNSAQAEGIGVQEILDGYRDSFGDLRDLSDEETEIAFRELSRLAAHENSEAMYFLAKMYLTGNGITANADLGLDLLKKASSKGNKLANLAIGACYLYGIGVKKDISEADKRLRYGINSKNPAVMKTIADLYAEKGLETQAAIWYKKAGACDNDNAKSAFSKTTKNSATTISLNPVVVIKNIHLSGEKERKGEKGFWVYCSWIIEKLRGSRVTIAANFFWAGGAKVLAGRSSFRSPEGQLSIKEETDQLPYDSTSYKNYRLFMPYAALPTKRDGTFHMKLSIEVSYHVDFKKFVIANSEDFYFDVVVTSGKIVVKAL